MDPTREEIEEMMKYQVPKLIQGISQIENFYSGKTVFVTGSTGYLGKCIVEKLLRGCPRLKKMYLLIRPKHNVTVEERTDKYFKNIIFDLVRSADANFQKKVIPVSGDLMKEDLGLTTKDRSALIEETDIIIHNGACVLFDVPTSMLLRINVFGTKSMLDLAMDCKKLQAFVYVSTAYSHCYKRETKEEFYDPPANLKMVQDMVKADEENSTGLNATALQVALSPWPNTYTFTKATAESFVQQYGRRAPFPCCVFRPSIVIATYKEPMKSWAGNLNGPVAAFLGAALGLIHAYPSNDKYIFDIIPADMTANGLLAVIWDLTENRKVTKEPQVYTYASSVANPLTGRMLEVHTLKTAYGAPPMKAVWAYFTLRTQSQYLFWILHIFLHFIPACIGDGFLIATGRKPKALSIFFKVTKHLDKAIYFSNGDWRHDTTEMSKVWDRMNEKDHLLFNNDLRSLSWVDYFKTYWFGMRLYLLNDPFDTIPTAKRRYAKIQMAHYTVMTLLGLGFIYFLVGLFNLFLSF